jgi:outer membrane lipoprotein-sorting protein
MKLIMTLLFFIIFAISQSHSKSFVPSSFSANFEEIIYKPAIKKEVKSFGKIDYKFKGNIRYEVISPEPLLFVTNSQKSWVYQPPFVPTEHGNVTIQKSSNLPIIKILDSLNNGLEGSKLFATSYSGKDLLLTFSPEMQKESSVKTLTLHTTKDAKSIQSLKEFDSLTLQHTDGKIVKMKLLEMKEDLKFDAKHFVFSVPEKTKVTTN